MTEQRLSWADRHKKPERPPLELKPINGGTVNGHGYGAAALAGEVEKLLATGEGARNDQLNTSAFNLAQLVASGHLDQAEVTDTLRAAALHIGLTPSEVDATLRSGHNAGSKLPRVITPLPEILPNVQEVSAISLAGCDFWTRMPILTHIRNFAYARMTSPWSLLGVCILRALAIIPPHVVLPPLIGGYGSLNLFVALVGPSGVGKGAAEAAAIDAIDFGEDIYTAPVGSGEGIAHQYAHRERSGVERDRDSVLFTVSEADTLSALGSRQGSTLLSQLRSAFSGERLGFGYADATKRIPIDRHTYRLGMTVGVQPEKAGPIIFDADGGTPQRFVWVTATDPHIDPDPPPPPRRWTIERQHFTSGRDGFHVLSVPETVVRTIRGNHAARARGEGETLDGHALFAREKVAQAIAFLDQRRVMTEDDWDIAGAIMRVSDATRTHITATLERQQQTADTVRAQREAHRSVVVSETVTEAALKRVAAKIRRTVAKQTAGMSWSELRRAMSSRDREYFDEAVERLISAGQIQVTGDAPNRHVAAVGSVT